MFVELAGCGWIVQSGLGYPPTIELTTQRSVIVGTHTHTVVVSSTMSAHESSPSDHVLDNDNGHEDDDDNDAVDDDRDVENPPDEVVADDAPSRLLTKASTTSMPLQSKATSDVIVIGSGARRHPSALKNGDGGGATAQETTNDAAGAIRVVGIMSQAENAMMK